jgi:hypothetical protein
LSETRENPEHTRAFPRSALNDADRNARPYSGPRIRHENGPLGQGDSKPDWKGRYDTIFARMESLGMLFVSPQRPSGTRRSPETDEQP